MKIVLYATCCFGIVFSSVASAQVCQASNSTLNGAYGFVANELSPGKLQALVPRLREQAAPPEPPQAALRELLRQARNFQFGF